jgi:hypothetical protein
MLLITAGAAVTVTGLILAGIASYIPVSTYLVLALLGSGPLLLTWPNRVKHRFPHSPQSFRGAMPHRVGMSVTTAPHVSMPGCGLGCRATRRRTS